MLADLARGVLRKKIPDLTLALAGRFADHHALLCRLHLTHIDHLNDMIGKLDARIEQVIIPFAAQRDRLKTIPGVGDRAAQTIIAEIGVDMTRFPTPAHLASWAGLCPGNHESAGKRRKGTTRHGNPHLATVLVEAAWATSRTRTRLGARYRRLHRRFGKTGSKKAAVAIAHRPGHRLAPTRQRSDLHRPRRRLLHPARRPGDPQKTACYANYTTSATKPNSPHSRHSPTRRPSKFRLTVSRAPCVPQAAARRPRGDLAGSAR
ncbi:transposase [Micromonospora sp. NPDC004551]|uniref:transposase n=1 Tax=Micromonospora sp. NPDC004551 TaxID=3154284 RepID=UPI0033A3599D